MHVHVHVHVNEHIHVHVHVQRAVTNPLDDSDEVFENGLPPLVSDDCSSDITEDVWAAGVDGIEVAVEEREGGREREN